MRKLLLNSYEDFEQLLGRIGCIGICAVGSGTYQFVC